MKIRALKARTTQGRTIHAGESFKASPEDAEKLIASGDAAYIGPPPKTRAPVQVPKAKAGK